MMIRIPEYKGNKVIVSLALDEDAKRSLQCENVHFWSIDQKHIISFPEQEVITENEDVCRQFLSCNNYDVFEIYDDGSAYRSYDDSSNENVFFITGKCNSNCVMCPSSDYSRKNGVITDIDALIEIASLIPSDVRFITITGGEPFMAGKDLFRLLQYCREKFETTEFQILTNGRIFAVKEYADLLKESIPERCIIGIPIHGSTDKIHDAITRTSKSFSQTVAGVKRLLKRGIPIELRIVVCKKNAEDLAALAEFIVEEFPGTDHVSIMAMEMTGSAAVNKDDVWMSYRDSYAFVEPAIRVFMNAGMDVRLYNFPLCTVDRNVWPICAKSISTWKVKYAEVCDDCIMKTSCGGVFGGTYRLESEELRAVI